MGITSIFSALTVFLNVAKNAGPVVNDLIAGAEQVGADVSAHKPVVQSFNDALAALEKAVHDASGV